jgi:hypothetical protein
MPIRGAPGGLSTRSNPLELSPSTGSLMGRVLGLFTEKETLCAISDRPTSNANRPKVCKGGAAPAPNRGPSAPPQRPRQAVYFRFWQPDRCQQYRQTSSTKKRMDKAFCIFALHSVRGIHLHHGPRHLRFVDAWSSESSQERRSK